LGGKTINSEMLARLFSIITDCLERRNSQLLALYEPWKEPANIDTTVRTYVKRRLFERGLDEDGHPLTEEKMQEMVNAPVDELFQVSREKVDQYASDRAKMDVLAAAVKNQMQQTHVATPDPEPDNAE
jgi:phage terminase large subunit GpA-like protein